MDAAISFSLKYSGGEADDHHIDLYDVSQALIGFQRSLALTCQWPTKVIQFWPIKVIHLEPTF